MPMKQTGRKVYKSMQGKQIDMDLLRQRNELTPAVGNAKVNARGDEIGPGGKIVRSKEEILKDYYKSNKGVDFEQPIKKETATDNQPSTTPSAAELQEFEDIDDGWVEDENGDFVKK